MILAIEDAVSEAVARKMLAEHNIEVSVALGRRGNGYLKQKAHELNRTAQTRSVFLLTDLDSPNRCPAALKDSWIPKATVQPRLIFRVAVLEVESWLMAHREGFADFAGVSEARVPKEPDLVPNPKQTLVNLCRKSKKTHIRTGMVPKPGSTAQVGPDYNPRLTEFVCNLWSPVVAARTSPSFRRALESVQKHIETFGV
jgi:hypothetical protein